MSLVLFLTKATMIYSTVTATPDCELEFRLCNIQADRALSTCTEGCLRPPNCQSFDWQCMNDCADDYESSVNRCEEEKTICESKHRPKEEV